MGAAGYPMPASFPFVRLSVTKIHLIHKLNLLNAASIIIMWINVWMMGAPTTMQLCMGHIFMSAAIQLVPKISLSTLNKSAGV